jgi:hypothetical protein
MSQLAELQSSLTDEQSLGVLVQVLSRALQESSVHGLLSSHSTSWLQLLDKKSGGTSPGGLYVADF